MAIILIENNSLFKGYISMRNIKDKKHIEYHIEYASELKDTSYRIGVLDNYNGYFVKEIHFEPTLNKNKLCVNGNLETLNTINDARESDLGIYIQNKEGKILFANYFKKRDVDFKLIKIDNSFDGVRADDKHIDEIKNAKKIDETQNKTDKDKDKDSDKECAIENNIEPDDKINTKEVDYIEEAKLNWREFETEDFTSKMSKIATIEKETRIDNCKTYIYKICYNVFKNAYIDGNNYYTAVNSIITMFKSDIKLKGHFLLSVLLKRNGEIKSIQLGIPVDMENTNQTMNICKNIFTYKYFNEKMGAYWMYNFEV